MAKAQCTFVSSWDNGLEIKTKAMVCLKTGEVTDIEVSETLPDDDAELIEEYIEIANSTFQVVDVNEENTYFVIDMAPFKAMTANLSTESVRFIVPRDSHDETTIAVVDAEVDQGLCDKSAFLNALDSALANWFTTDHGKAVWESTCCDFNIGDLSEYQAEPALTAFLNDQGIKKLRVDTFSHDGRCNWSYDRVLGNP
jgi:hypothetical protein